MKSLINPPKKKWTNIVKRPVYNQDELFAQVRTIIDEIQTGGDNSLKKLTLQFDGIDLKKIQINKAEIQNAKKNISATLKKAIQQSYKNIYCFHHAQKTQFQKIETMPGITCWQKSVPIESIGLYIPGGSAPLFSTVLMIGIPAKIAGCKKIVLCTPPSKNNVIHPAILYAANLIGIEEIYTVGGAQAIAAMALGTKTISKVYKIFGPGNQFVTAAKQLVQLRGTAIDMPAGPTELCICIDETANIDFIASDVLAQAEHGIDSQIIIITNQPQHIQLLIEAVHQQIQHLPRKNIAEKALKNSSILLFENRQDVIDFINLYAPEHLIVVHKKASTIVNAIVNAGSVFIGNYSPEAVGDYASGTNHTLPTSGFSKMYSGIHLDSFYKRITFQKITKTGLKNIAETVITMSENENLQAHSNSVKIRLGMKNPYQH